MTTPISPLTLNPLSRDTWGNYDASVIAQLALLAADPCYTMKFYKAPSSDQEVMAANAFATYGMRITPGSLIFGFYLPCVMNEERPWTSAPNQFWVQITDVDLNHKWFSDPLASLFLANFKPTFMSQISTNMGSFPNLLASPYPVVGRGAFKIDIQNGPTAQRNELVFGVLEVC